MINVVITAVIVLYAGSVVRKKLQNFRRGRFCSSDCSQCQNGCYMNMK